jgi:hypothetical protein
VIPVVIPISGEIQPSNPIPPRRASSRKNQESTFEELLVDRVEAVDEGEQGKDDRKSHRQNKEHPGHGGFSPDDPASVSGTQSDNAEVKDLRRGRNIDLRV